MTQPANANEQAKGLVRALTPADLDRVVEIDRVIGGASRRGFFEKRLAASLRAPKAYVTLGFVENGGLEGFVMAHVLDGEFGGREPVAALDAIAISASSRGHGGTHALMAALQDVARRRGARELRTQVLWSDQALRRFLAAAGFSLGHRLVLERPCARIDGEATTGESQQDDSLDYSRDRVAVRSLGRSDLGAIVEINAQATGEDRSNYFARKLDEALNDAGIRVSLLADYKDTPAGFIMARVDYGEFGETAAEAVMDTLAVNPEFAGKHVGATMMRQLLANLQTLQVERIRTELGWDEFELLAFLKHLGFRPSQRLSLTREL